jgi:4,5-dihydroxyphthalate decarboxylase
MSQEELTLSVALSDNERTRPIIHGRAKVQSVKLLITVVHPSEMFWRQLKFGDFDISEMSLASLFIAVARGDRRWVALPIFTMRMFCHTGILVRADRDIRTPSDLKGKRIGVPEYQQTSALWSRGVLQHEFDVHPREIIWFMERGPEKSHGGATGFKPPPGVSLNQIPESTNIGQMLANGELDASLLYLTNHNLVDRSRLDVASIPSIKPLFDDQEAEGRRFFAKTGLYPINHVVVVKRELLERHPWLAINIYHAFIEAKAEAEHEAGEVLKSYFETGLVDPRERANLKADPKPYGFAASQKVLETISQYLHEQSLTDHRMPPAELFARSTLDL